MIQSSANASTKTMKPDEARTQVGAARLRPASPELASGAGMDHSNETTAARGGGAAAGGAVEPQHHGNQADGPDHR